MRRRRISAGVALYRRTPRLAVLLVRELRGAGRGTWGIPKGAVDSGEAVDAAARRELREETGIVLRGPLANLGIIDHVVPHGRTLAFAAPAPRGARPRPAAGEVDRAAFVELGRARRIIHPEQRALIDRLHTLLWVGRASPRRRGAELDADVDVEAYLRDK